MNYLVLVMIWIAYCALHSGLITPKVTGFFKRKLGESYRFYRLFYNIFAIASLIPVLIYTDSIRQTPFFTWDGYLLPVRYLLLAAGVLLFYAGVRQYDMSSFFGIKQIREKVDHNLINDTGELCSDGILGFVRHPFYTGVFPLIWATDLDVPILIVNSILSVYVIIGTLLEEQKLIDEFGDKYREYQRKVSMLFPLKWILQKIRTGTDQ